MLKIVEKYISDHQLLNKNQAVLVGVSGGPDSMVLLDVLLKLGYSCEIAHVNFRLRGKDSEYEMNFVQTLAEKLNIPCHVSITETKQYAKENGISIEMAARDIRYGFFEKLIGERALQAIAVGHHSDDSAETMLINLVRGTGLRGLSGIAPKNKNIVRPLLIVSRNQILSYASEQNIAFCTDASNMDTDIIRNKFRHQILPELITINPSVISSLNKTADILRETQKVVDYAISQWMKIHKQEGTGRILIDRHAIFEFPSPKILLFEIISQYGFSSDLVDQLYETLKHQPGKQFFSATHRIITGSDTLIIIAQNAIENQTYCIDKIGHCENLPIAIKLQKKMIATFASEPKTRFCAYFDANKIEFPLVLRRWETGDWFIPFGQTGRKKVSDFFIDNKLSLDQKEAVWLLCSGNQIIWLVGFRADNRYKVDKETTEYIKIEWTT